MPDATVTSTTQSAGQYPVWDLSVVNGVCPIIDGDFADLQAAQIAAFTQLGSVPSLPSVGVDWTGFMGQSLDFGTLDQTVRQAIEDAGLTEFSPSYSLDGDQLITTISKGAA